MFKRPNARIPGGYFQPTEVKDQLLRNHNKSIIDEKSRSIMEIGIDELIHHERKILRGLCESPKECLLLLQAVIHDDDEVFSKRIDAYTQSKSAIPDKQQIKILELLIDSICSIRSLLKKNNNLIKLHLTVMSKPDENKKILESIAAAANECISDSCNYLSKMLEISSDSNGIKL